MDGCRICRAQGPLETLTVREMLFGTRETFVYEHCHACGSLQIQTLPPDPARYYPPGYQAHAPEPRGVRTRVRRRLAAVKDYATLFAPSPVHRLARALPVIGAWLRNHPLASLRGRLLARHARVADVGGGNGHVLGALFGLGFRDLTCIDPFVAPGAVREGIRHLPAHLAEVDERFDLIMYHHALEHVIDLDAELEEIGRHLSPAGIALVRMPLLPNEAFDLYREHWVQIDAPRHIHVPSRDGIARAAARHGLEVEAGGDDSTGFQFWASEGYLRDVPLVEQGAAREWARAGRRVERERDARAHALNARGRGDQGWLILRPTPHAHR